MQLSQKDFAAMLGLTSRQVRNLGDKGMPSQADGNRRWYDQEAFAWYVEFKLQEVRSELDVSPREHMEMERLKHQTREAKVRADLAERSAVSVEEDVEFFKEACELIRTAIQQLPPRYGDVVNPEDPAQGESGLEEVAHELIEEINLAFSDLVSPPDREVLADAA